MERRNFSILIAKPHRVQVLPYYKSGRTQSPQNEVIEPPTVLGDRVLAVENHDDSGLRYLSIARLGDFAFALYYKCSQGASILPPDSFWENDPEKCSDSGTGCV
jgi:hypothetical protein